jgi:hypothetical protein
VRHNALDKNRGAGSVGIGGIARSELMVKKRGGSGVLRVEKRNNAPPVAEIGYRFVSVGEVARLEWGDPNSNDDNQPAATTGRDDTWDRVALVTARERGAVSGPQLHAEIVKQGGTGSESKANRTLRTLAARGLIVMKAGATGRKITQAGLTYLAERGW